MDKPIAKPTAGMYVGFGCAALFGLPFLCGGLYMTWSLVSMLWLAQAAKSWVEAPADLKTVELEGSDTQHVVATYEYVYEGQEYPGDRVGLLESQDNVGKHHKQLFKRLNEAKKKGRPVVCYVDPKHPEHALLDRTLRPAMVIFHLPFVVVFTLVGVGLTSAGVFASKSMLRDEALKAANPDRPWRWRDDWITGEVRSTGKKDLTAALVFAVLWNGISLPGCLLFLSGDSDAPWWVGIIMLLFPAVGAWLAWRCLKIFLIRRRYGESVFRLATKPGVIGGKLRGVIEASSLLEQADGVRLTLSCTKKVGSGDDRKTIIVWQDERVIDRLLDAGDPSRVGVPVDLTIPSDGVISTDAEDDVVWKLKAQAKSTGIDYEAEFEVPVFRTEDTQVGIEVPEAGEFEREESLEDLLFAEGVRIEPLGALDSVRYLNPPASKPLVSMIMTLVAAGFLAGCVGALIHGERFVAAVLGLFACVLTLASLELWLGSSDLRIVGDYWESRSGWYGFRRRRSFTRRDIMSLDTKVSSHQSNQEGKPKTKHVIAKLAGGETVTLVRSLHGPVAIRKLLDDLRLRAGHE
ncbi:hypothetical protein MalM25_33820 [Planctomycetes bacterium MalM25]|nr:hypothetical protein MalM25_33820 [Planctomycetes bacterium MalM25]